MLNDLTGIYYGYLIAYLCDDPQVVGDHDHGGAELLSQLLHGLQYLGLDGHIQSRGGLVGNQKLRVAGQGHGDDHTLLHSAGELVGVLAVTLFGDPYHL